MTGASTTVERDALLDALEDVWQTIDRLFDELGPADWGRAHGPDWTVADVPFHLSYFDRELVALPLERGADVPDEVRAGLMRSTGDIDAWNAARFAERPAGLTVAGAREAARASRVRVRDAATHLDDAALDGPVFVPLAGMGWITARTALTAAIGHDWNHAAELRLRLGLGPDAPRPGAAATQRALDFYTDLIARFARPAAAGSRPFTAVFVIEGPGGGAWSIRVAEGAAQHKAGVAPDADLVMSQDVDGFVRTLNGLHNPMVAILTGRIKVRGKRQLGRFGKVFAPPEPGEPIAPRGEAPW